MGDDGGIVPQRWLIVGAGAIGGLLGVPLSLRGHKVTFVARGSHLRAMQDAGCMVLERADGTIERSSSESEFTSDLDSLPAASYDVVVLALKMHQISAVVTLLPRLLSSDGVYLATQNGIPWWYFQRNERVSEELRGQCVSSVDPDGTLRDTLDPTRMLACVVYPAAHIKEPGFIRHTYGVRFPLGELDGASTPRARRICAAMVDAGFKCPLLENVRAECWLKLWGTVAVNPLSALTHATLGELCDPAHGGRQVVEAVMREVETVAEALGEKMRKPIEARVEGARSVGAHKTSMLQDVECGRRIEVDGVMGAVVELARITGVSTPSLDAVYGTTRMLEWVLANHNAKLPLLPLSE